MTSETEEKKTAEDAAKKVAEIAEKMSGFAKVLLDFVVVAVPVMIKYGRLFREHMEKLPENALNFIIGFIFCFFGGLYPVLFAAVQAAEHGGRKKVLDAIHEISDEVVKIIDESKKDDDEDADKDGKADVSQLDSKEFVQRKVLLVLKKINPQKVDNAMASIYQVWVAVAAVLTIQFARAISLALSIADFMNRPVEHYCTPFIKKFVPDEYDKWVPVVSGWITKSIAMSIAWYIQSLRSALASALIGGLMMARASYEALRVRDITLGGIIKKDHNDTMADEYLSYVYAAMGFTFQLMLGFDLPFPFNVILWPFELGEWAIRWSITSATHVPN